MVAMAERRQEEGTSKKDRVSGSTGRMGTARTAVNASSLTRAQPVVETTPGFNVEGVETEGSHSRTECGTESTRNRHLSHSDHCV